MGNHPDWYRSRALKMGLGLGFENENLLWGDTWMERDDTPCPGQIRFFFVYPFALFLSAVLFYFCTLALGVIHKTLDSFINAIQVAFKKELSFRVFSIFLNSFQLVGSFPQPRSAKELPPPTPPFLPCHGVG